MRLSGNKLVLYGVLAISMLGVIACGTVEGATRGAETIRRNAEYTLTRSSEHEAGVRLVTETPTPTPIPNY